MEIDAMEMRREADRRFELMLEDRREYEPWWMDLRRQFAPNRGRFTVREKPRKDILRKNSKPRQIPDDFAAGIKSGLTSPSRPWFTLTLFDGRLAELERVKAWLTKVQDIMQGTMIRTNLYDQLFDVYKEQGIFGTGCLLVEEDDEDVFHARSLTVGSYAIGVDEKRRVNRLGQSFSYTLRQLAAEFGEDALPEELKLSLREGPENRRFEVRHLIEPSEEFRRGDGKAGMYRYRSLWWLAGYKTPEFLRISGYNERPFMAPRWRIVGDDLYGREQPGDVGLDDARTIQELETDERSAIKKGVNPPLLVPQTLITSGDLHNYPNGATLYENTGNLNGPPMIVPLYSVSFDHQSVAAKRMELIARLEETFYVNFFRMWTSDLRQGRTATEIQARESEKMYMLGPLIERQMSEMLDPLIERIFGIMERRGMFPPPPEELMGSDVKIEYTSILANVQKQAAQAGMEIVIQTVGLLAQMQGSTGQYPAVLDKLDCDEVIDQLSDAYALPAGIVLGDDAVAELRAMRERQQQEQAQQQQMAAAAMQAAQAAPQVSGAMKDMAETPLDGGSALEAMAGMMGGGEVM